MNNRLSGELPAAIPEESEEVKEEEKLQNDEIDSEEEINRPKYSDKSSGKQIYVEENEVEYGEYELHNPHKIITVTMNSRL